MFKYTFIFLSVFAGQAMAADQFGAIAYSQSGRHYGWSVDGKSRSEVQKAATKQCRHFGGGCKSIWFLNACGALAIGRDGGWGMNWGASASDAKRKAMLQCKKVSSGCRVETIRCTGNAH